MMRLKLVLILACLASGCASRNYYYQIPDYETAQIIPDVYEAGEVVRVELVAPGRRVAYDCEDSYASFFNYNQQYCRYSARVRDAVPLRGPDGIINFFPGGRLLWPFGEKSSSPDDTIGVSAAQGLGWKIYNTVRLDNEREITIVDSEDKGFLIGESVRVGFNESFLGSSSKQVYLLSSEEDDVVPVVEHREPPGPWGRINAQLQQELAVRAVRPGPADLLYVDPEHLSKNEQIVLKYSGSRLLHAIEEEYVDFTLGIRSNAELREPIGVIFETNLGLGVHEAWKEYKKEAMPEFASWFESNFLPR